MPAGMDTAILMNIADMSMDISMAMSIAAAAMSMNMNTGISMTKSAARRAGGRYSSRISTAPRARQSSRR